MRTVDLTDPDRAESSYGVIVAEHQPIFRQGLIEVIRRDDGLYVLGEADTAQCAVQKCITFNPDIIILDMMLPGGGFWAAIDIAQLPSPPRIVMLASVDTGIDFDAARRAGVEIVIPRTVSVNELTQQLKFIEPDERPRPRVVDPRGLTVPRRVPDGAWSTIASLSARKKEILKLVAEGKSNKEIGETLGLKEKTIKHYMTVLLKELNARNRVEVAVLAHNVSLGGNSEPMPRQGRLLSH